MLILSIRRMEEICKGKAADADGWAFSMDRFLRLPRVMSTSNLSVWALSVSSGESCFSQATILHLVFQPSVKTGRPTFACRCRDVN